MDYSAIVDPEYAKYLGSVMPRQSRAPQNVGEGLTYIGEKVNESAWRNVMLGEMAKDRAAYNGVVGRYAQAVQGGFAPPSIPSQPKGMLDTPPATRPDQATAPAGGMISGPPASSQPPQGASGMLSAPPQPQSTGMLSDPQQRPSPTQVAPAQSDPFAARRAAIQREIAATAELLRHPRTMAMGVQKMQALNDQLAQLDDPEKLAKVRNMDLDSRSKEEEIAKKRRDADLVQSILGGGTVGGTGGTAHQAQGGGVAVGPAAEGGTVLAARPGMPPGMYPGGMIPQEGIEGSMVPLSPEAERAKKIMTLGGLMGNRALETAGKNALDYDPTALAQKKQAEGMGQDAAKRADARRAGAQILKSFAALQHSFEGTDDKVLKGAIGPYATAPYTHWMPGVGGMTPPQVAAAYGDIPVIGTLAKSQGKSGSWDTQNLFGHDVHGITTSFMSNAGRALNMSDARQAAFESTMKDFMKAGDRKSAQTVLEHAKGIIANDFGLSPKEAEAVIAHHLEELRAAKGGGAAQRQGPVKVGSPDEAASLPKGTRFIGHDGVERIRQ